MTMVAAVEPLILRSIHGGFPDNVVSHVLMKFKPSISSSLQVSTWVEDLSRTSNISVILSRYHLHILSLGGKGTTSRYSRATFSVSCCVTCFINAADNPSGSSFSVLLSCHTALANTHARSLFKHHLKISSSLLS